VKKSEQNISQRRRELIDRLSKGDIEIAEAVRELRHLVGKNQSSFAKMVGLSRVAILNLENGRANPTAESLNKIFALVGMEVGLVTKQEKKVERLAKFLMDS